MPHNVRPTQQAIDEAAKITTGFPEAVEQQAIEVARRAYDMNPVSTAVAGAFQGQRFTTTESRNIVRANEAALAVNAFLKEKGYSENDLDMRSEGVDLLLQAGQRIVTDRVEARHGITDVPSR